MIDTMAETMTEREEIYLFKRDDVERQRLNEQHDMLRRLCRDNLLDSQISQTKLLNIADVATGTGIWLEDVAGTLSGSSPAVREYTGFDISAEHFPRSQKPGMAFHEHDILQPFPVEFHSRYDLVHIRLLVLALRKDQFEAAVTNAAALLKPGGYIQWEEFETKNMTFNPPSDITTQVRAIMQKYAQANGLTNTPCADISQYLNALGFEDVRVVDYNSSSREDMASEAREWTKAGWKAGLYYALLKDGSGRGPEETRALAEDLLAKYVQRIDEGVVPTIPLARVVGRKQ